MLSPLPTYDEDERCQGPSSLPNDKYNDNDNASQTSKKSGNDHTRARGGPKWSTSILLSPSPSPSPERVRGESLPLSISDSHSEGGGIRQSKTISMGIERTAPAVVRGINLPMIYRSPPTLPRSPPILTRLDTSTSTGISPTLHSQQYKPQSQSQTQMHTPARSSTSTSSIAAIFGAPTQTQTTLSHQRQPSMPSLSTLHGHGQGQGREREFYPTPISMSEKRWPPPIPPFGVRANNGTVQEHQRHLLASHASPAYAPSPRRPQPSYAHNNVLPHPFRPRLQIHPYAPPMEPESRYAYHSAGGAGLRRDGLGGMGIWGPPGGMESSYRSPASAISPGGYKAPRKRADDTQLSILIDAFERTSYPSTEERDALARKLGMTSRSVQIWFQNRRRAVKVESQSAAQRAQQVSMRPCEPRFFYNRDQTRIFTDMKMEIEREDSMRRDLPNLPTITRGRSHSHSQSFACSSDVTMGEKQDGVMGNSPRGQSQGSVRASTPAVKLEHPSPSPRI